MLPFLLSIADEAYQASIERIFNRYHRRMLRLSLKQFKIANRNNPTMDAEDAVQSTFLCIVKYANVIPFDKPERELKAYIFTILQNEISKILGEAELMTQPNFENYADKESLLELGERIYVRDQYAEIVAAIREMDLKYSTVLYMYYCEEISVEQIAEMLGVSKSTVYTRLRRGKQQLIQKFAKEGAV